MTAAINFFCTASEESDVLRYLLSTGEVLAFDRAIAHPQTLPTIDALAPPAWPAPFSCFLWLRSCGPLQWHSSRPAVGGATHGDLVHSVLVNQSWSDSPPPAGAAMLDTNRSPVFLYRRGRLDGQNMGPCGLASTPSAAERVSPDFARWVRRCFSWIRGRSTRIHDWRSPHPTLANPFQLASSIYAFPKALEAIASGKHEFTIL